MVTTIQINHDVKDALNRMKATGKETYEQVILQMIRIIEKQKREQEGLMIEGCKEMFEDMIKINKEWESVDAELDWEWDGEF